MRVAFYITLFVFLALNVQASEDAREEVPVGKSTMGISFSEPPDPCGLRDVICVNEITASVTKYLDTGIMASGKQTYIGAIACPRNYPFGTKVEIDGVEYTCEDRTHYRYDGRFDIFTDESYEDALKWGKQSKEILVYGGDR